MVPADHAQRYPPSAAVAAVRAVDYRYDRRRAPGTTRPVGKPALCRGHAGNRVGKRIARCVYFDIEAAETRDQGIDAALVCERVSGQEIDFHGLTVTQRDLRRPGAVGNPDRMGQCGPAAHAAGEPGEREGSLFLDVCRAACLHECGKNTDQDQRRDQFRTNYRGDSVQGGDPRAVVPTIARVQPPCAENYSRASDFFDPAIPARGKFCDRRHRPPSLQWPKRDTVDSDSVLPGTG